MKNQILETISTAVETAIILAAGMGTRLSPLTDGIPKCLVAINGVPIILNTLTNLAEFGITHTVIVVGHLKDNIKETIGDKLNGMSISYIESDSYNSTNNIYSLWLAREYLSKSVLLLEADIVFEKELIFRLLDSQKENLMAVVGYESWMSGTVVRINNDGKVKAIIESKSQDKGFDYIGCYKTANIYRFNDKFLSNYFLPKLNSTIKNGNTNSYYENILVQLCDQSELDIYAINCDDLNYVEIDNYNDLMKAQYLFDDRDQQYEHVSGLFGDYWRYDFVDHNFLYNLFFPPESLIKDIKDNIRNLLLNYPSGQEVIAGLTAVLIDQPSERIVVGNGASELIRVVCQGENRRLTVPVPSFNEWINAAYRGSVCESLINQSSFRLDVKKLLDDAIQFESDTVIVVNPNNPTSLFTPKSELIWLADQLADKDIMLVIDESFIDFTDNASDITMEKEIETYQNLSIIKSLSKCYGIGGLRLGYLLTNNLQLIEEARRSLPIWNINGIAESFLRLAPRYSKEFRSSCEKVREVRDDLYRKLKSIPELTVFKPSANFVFCKLPEKTISSPELAKEMFIRNNILIKHCGGKHMLDGNRYLRIACRNQEDSSVLADAMRALLEEFGDNNINNR
jgi:histidinol-phosphate/aromatic aminotransferase/cobyric acid decarboxylase-like protein/CTP:molybdopterin cytidylyltransferase MocA